MSLQDRSFRFSRNSFSKKSTNLSSRHEIQENDKLTISCSDKDDGIQILCSQCLDLNRKVDNYASMHLTATQIKQTKESGKKIFLEATAYTISSFTFLSNPF